MCLRNIFHLAPSNFLIIVVEKHWFDPTIEKKIEWTLKKKFGGGGIYEILLKYSQLQIPYTVYMGI